MKNNVWDVVPRPQDKVFVTSKWLYKIKHGADGSAKKYKARFVARGFSHKEDIDYDEIFALVAQYTTIHSIIAIAASQGWNLHQMDVKTTLKKALYGIKQAPRAWYDRIDSYLMKLGFTMSEADPNLYFNVEYEKPLILVLYIDDLFLIGADRPILKCKRELAFEFEMKDLALMHYFLGLEFWQKPREIFLSQGKYVVNILERLECYRVSSSHQSIDVHVELLSRYMFCSQHMVEPHHTHWIVAKNLLTYLRGKITHGLRYTAKDVRLHGYTDVDWASSVVDRKRTSGCCFSFGSTSISWMSRKHKSVALSTAEVEYISASMASCEAV
eukprot:PITA_19367